VKVRELVLVTAADCHLCAHAREVLEKIGREEPLAVREIDVESDEARDLAEAGVPLAFLPVLWDGSRVLGYGRLSERRLRRELAA
jgi:glutaredoxin